METKKASPLFKFIKWLVRVFYPKIEVIGTENLPEEPAVIVGNHTQMNGPISCELYYPRERYTWCSGQMMHLKDVPAYAFKDFWSSKPKSVRWFYKILSYVIAPLSVCVFNNANTVGVYRDMRIISTFRESVEKLECGADIVIFPEHDEKYNHIINSFQDKFVDTARYYYKKTGKELCFVPLYIAPKLKKMYIGKPIRFRSASPIAEERRRICEYLMSEITDMAVRLPEHTVVPYRKKYKVPYSTNIPREVTSR